MKKAALIICGVGNVGSLAYQRCGLFRTAKMWRYNPLMRKFQLVDFAAHFQKGFRNHIVPISDVPALVESYDHYGCYSTYFFYSDEILTYMSAQGEQSFPSIASYDGKVWAPFFPIDLDHQELAAALAAARQLTTFFIEHWEIDQNAVQVYFSGSKGFHIMLDSRVFGRIMPSKNLPLIFDAMRRHFVQELPEQLRNTMDLAIKDRLRLLRLPNTVHEKSKLHKIILSLDELQDLSPEDIKSRASTPRPLTVTDETGLVANMKVEQNPAAAKFFARIRRQLNRIVRKPFRYRFRRPDDLGRIEFPCAGIQAIWQSHIEPGYRNNCAIRLASEFRLMGLTAEETNEKLLEWNVNNGIELPVDEIMSVVRSAYQHRFPYRYSCQDAILRRFCPLANYAACREFVSRHGDPDHG